MFDIGKWLKVYDYKNLDSFFNSEKGKGGIGEALARVFVSQLIMYIPILIIGLVYMLVISGTLALGGGKSALAGTLLSGMGIIGIIAILAVSFVFGLVMFLVSNGVIHVIAGMLGGKGTYKDLNYLFSFISAASALGAIVLFVIALVLAFIPCGGCIVLPIEIAWLIYLLFADYKAIIANYGLSSGRAIATIVLEIIFWLVLSVLLFLAILMLLGLSLGSIGALAGSFTPVTY